MGKPRFTEKLRLMQFVRLSNGGILSGMFLSVWVLVRQLLRYVLSRRDLTRPVGEQLNHRC